MHGNENATKENFKCLTKLLHSENTICKLIEKYIIDELDIVHEHLLVKLFKFFVCCLIIFLHIYHVLVSKYD